MQQSATPMLSYHIIVLFPITPPPTRDVDLIFSSTNNTNMAWEWRIFFENNGGDAFTVLESGNNQQQHSMVEERRTDLYQTLGHARLGLKFRGGGGESQNNMGHACELKIRVDRTEDGWERWTKRRLAVVSMPELEFLQDLDESLHQHVQQFLKENDVTSSGAIRVYKRRVQFCRGDAVLEQSDLQITMQNDDRLLGKYRTICVDAGSRNSVLPKQILEQMGSELVSRSMICGYPEFLERLVVQSS